VHDALPFGRAAGGDAVPDSGEAADHRRAGPARARVGGHADRFVDHHDVVVGVHHPQPGHRLRHHLDGGGRVGQGDLQPRAGADLVGLGPGYAVDGGVAGLDQRCGGGAGEPEQPGDRLVEAHPVEAVGHRQRP
jgi:hypothetical protein